MRKQIAACVLAVLAGCTGRDAAPVAVPDTQDAILAIVATCATAVGEVQVRRPRQAGWEPVEPGTVFRVGDEVRTGGLASARIEFLQGGGLELEERAAVVIDLAPPSRVAAAGGVAREESRVAVTQGVVRGFLPESAGPSGAGITIRSSDGSEVRIVSGPGEKAGRFRLSPGAGGTELAVIEGTAAVMGKQGQPVTLRAGQLALARSGGLAEPSELIGFPESLEPGVDAHLAGAAGKPVRLAWAEAPGATGYRVQIARDLSFQGLELVRDVAGRETSFVPPGVGVHAWRVASRDASGRYGEYGFARRLYCEEAPPRDLLVGPAEGAVIGIADRPARVTFSWSAVERAVAYRVVVAAGPDLAKEVASARVQAQEARLDLREAGELWWGVYAEGGAAPQPLFATPRRLLVRKAARPRAEVPKAISRWGE